MHLWGVSWRGWGIDVVGKKKWAFREGKEGRSAGLDAVMSADEQIDKTPFTKRES